MIAHYLSSDQFLELSSEIDRKCSNLTAQKIRLHKVGQRECRIKSTSDVWAVAGSCDHSQPIRGQYLGHVITLSQSEASIQVMWSLLANLRPVFRACDHSQPIRSQYLGWAGQTKCTDTARVMTDEGGEYGDNVYTGASCLSHAVILESAKTLQTSFSAHRHLY